MKKSFTILVTGLLLALAASCASGKGWVKVEGNKFIDPQGNELVFRGLCLADPVKLQGTDITAEQTEWIRSI